MVTDPGIASKAKPVLLEDSHYALHFLPTRQRAVVDAFDAFCRELRAIPKSVRDPGVAQAKLAWWQKEVDRCFGGQPTHPALQALVPHLGTYGIAREHLLAITEGCRMDLAQARYFSFPELQHYCDLVAGAREVVCARIFGQTAAQTADYARQAGGALQLTRLIRNVGRDGRRNRIYLPADELDRFSVPESEILAGTYSDRFARLMEFQVQRARGLFDAALDQLPRVDCLRQKPGLTQISLYLALLREIEAENYDVLSQRIDLSSLRKSWLAWKMQALGRF